MTKPTVKKKNHLMCDVFKQFQYFMGRKLPIFTQFEQKQDMKW